MLSQAGSSLSTWPGSGMLNDLCMLGHGSYTAHSAKEVKLVAPLTHFSTGDLRPCEALSKAGLGGQARNPWRLAHVIFVVLASILVFLLLRHATALLTNHLVVSPQFNSWPHPRSTHRAFRCLQWHPDSGALASLCVCCAICTHPTPSPHLHRYP